eukprot:scaffold1519_cov166-Amphora_coffeaeformis.AAC.7
MSPLASTRRLCLSMTGSGHLLVYQLGACRTLLQQCRGAAPPLAVDHVVGASGGAIAAAVLAANIPIDDYAHAFIQQRGRGMKLLQDYWSQHVSSESSAPNSSALRPGLHIATTRCEDGSSKIFSFDRLDDKERIFDCIQASCLIPPTFHPLDIMSSPSPYPEYEGLPIDDPVEGMDFYVDGGISTPAPMIVSKLEVEGNELITRVIISPVAGTSKHAARISPRTRGWWPQIQARHDMGLYLSWSNAKALRAASGNVSSSELQNWYDRGQDDAQRFLELFLRN